MSRTIGIDFDAEETKAVRAFDNVGNASKRMASKVDETTASQTRLGQRIGTNESKFMGTADLLDGLGGAFGLPTEGATALARGLGDLSGGFEVVSGMIPGLSGLFPKLSGAMTFISAHPLILGILAGGAIIAGLVLLEKKFGIVSSAVGGLGDALSWTWNNAIKPTINFIIGGVELMARAWAMPFTLLSKIPGVGSLIPSGLANIRLPRLDVGGTVLQTGVAVVHRGEVVSPAGSSSFGSAGGTVNIYIDGSVRDLVDVVHDGLLTKQSRGENLGIKAA